MFLHFKHELSCNFAAYQREYRILFGMVVSTNIFFNKICSDEQCIEIEQLFSLMTSQDKLFFVSQDLRQEIKKK